jgi:hypothetical protein
MSPRRSGGLLNQPRPRIRREIDKVRRCLDFRRGQILPNTAITLTFARHPAHGPRIAILLFFDASVLERVGVDSLELSFAVGILKEKRIPDVASLCSDCVRVILLEFHYLCCDLPLDFQFRL